MKGIVGLERGDRVVLDTMVLIYLFEDSPACPLCGKPMRRRTAAKGPHTGHPFWGCSAYPACKGILDITQEPDSPAKKSDESDKSDRSDSSDLSDSSS